MRNLQVRKHPNGGYTIVEYGNEVNLHSNRYEDLLTTLATAFELAEGGHAGVHPECFPDDLITEIGD